MKQRNYWRSSNKLALLLSLFLLAGCPFEDEDAGKTVISGVENQELKLVFSHNINGETHPCGCRKFPLGGLPQVAGQFHEIQKTHPMIYVDTGDTFFTGNVVPKFLEKSLKYNAKNLARGLKKLGLKYMVPGDQDFAAGLDFLKEIQKENEFKFVIANLRENAQQNFDAVPYFTVDHGPIRLIFIGILDPEVLRGPEKVLFSPPMVALPKILKELKEKKVLRKDRALQRLILLSHSGIENDKKIAQRFPEFDWIIGAHSQSFLNKTWDEGKTKIVQTLSRNHYLGEITIPNNKDSSEDKYQLIEMREEVAAKLNPNTWFAFIDQHKKEVEKLQIEEQSSLGETGERAPFATAQSCLECHAPQGEKWMKTAHSLAYHTLLEAGESKNLRCIQCHSHGIRERDGFVRALDMVAFKDVEKDAAKEKKLAEYLAAVTASFKKEKVSSVREATPEQRRKLAGTWMKHDEKFQVVENHANVQCLNCHETHRDHPFHIAADQTSKERADAMKNRCLACHDADQSPEWYQKDSSGRRGNLNQEYYQKALRDIACPKMEKE